MRHLNPLARTLWQTIRREDGQDLAEYVLLLSFVVLAAMAGVTGLGIVLDEHLRAVSNWLLDVL